MTTSLIEPGMLPLTDYLDRFPGVSERVAVSNRHHARNYAKDFRVECTCGALYKGTVFSSLDHARLDWIRSAYEKRPVEEGSFEVTTMHPYLVRPHHPSCRFNGKKYSPGHQRRYFLNFNDKWKNTHAMFELDVLDDDKLILKRSNLRVRKVGENLIAAVQPLLHIVMDHNGIVTSTVFRRRNGQVTGVETKVPLSEAQAKAELGRGVSLATATYIDERVEGHHLWTQTGLKEWVAFTSKMMPYRWSEYLAYQAKNPAAEQLVKMGQASFVSAKMQAMEDLGPSYKQAVGLPTTYLNRLRGAVANVIHWLEQLHQQDPVTEEQLDWLLVHVRGDTKRREFLERATELVRDHGYKTARLFDYMATIEFRQAINVDEAMRLLYDYREMAKTLEERDLPKYPGSLKLQHDLVTRRYTFVADEKKEERFQNIRKRRQDDYEVSENGYVIRWPETLAEIVAEGKALDHCVASYADKVANGQTMIFFARRANEPDVPWITIEVRDEHLVQARGHSNRHYTQIDKEFATFLHTWKSRRNIS